VLKDRLKSMPASGMATNAPIRIQGRKIGTTATLRSIFVLGTNLRLCWPHRLIERGTLGA
jgi:hypothetical protein